MSKLEEGLYYPFVVDKEVVKICGKCKNNLHENNITYQRYQKPAKDYSTMICVSILCKDCINR